MLDEQQIVSICNGYKNKSRASEVDGQLYLGQTAKKLGVDKDWLYGQIKKRGVALINSKEKVLHYHRTSIESAKSIVESGYLLNRENLKKRGVEVSSGSSSKNVQFTVDTYDKNGELSNEGFSNDLKVGASGSNIVFVMGPRLLEEESYDCLQVFPTVEKASIDDACVCIMADNEGALKEIQSFLASKGKKIPVIMQKDFNREKILGTLEGGKENKGEKSTKSCKEAYELVDFSDLASNKDMEILIKAVCYEGATDENKIKLHNYLQKQVEAGANVYKLQAQIMRETRLSPATVFKKFVLGVENFKPKFGWAVGVDKSQPESEKARLKDLARTGSYISRLVEVSPYEDIFKQLEEMERLKALKDSKERAGDFNQSNHFSDKISLLKDKTELDCERFDPEVLAEVAESKKAVENESLLIENGSKEESVQIVEKLTNTTRAINDLRIIARRQQREQGVSYERSL